MRGATLVLLAIGFLGMGGAGAAAEEIGIATLVKPQVQAFPPGQPPRDLVTKNPIERGLKVKLVGREAFLKVSFTRAFGCKQQTFDGRRISGVLTTLGPSDAELGDSTCSCASTRSCAPKVRFSLGKFWLALLPGEPPIDVDTPDAVSGVKGTYVRFLVDPVVGTFVGVDEGVVTVQAKAGGDPVEVEAGQWVVVPPGGLPTRPAPSSSLEVPDDSPLQFRDFTTEPPGRPPQ
jgi:hypothetical protein